MSLSWIIIYGLAFIIFSGILVFNLKTFHRQKKSAGEVQANWSRLYSLAFYENWLIGALVLAYFAWAGAAILQKSAAHAGFRRLLILYFVLAFVPHWNVVLGKNGFVHRLRFIPWQRVREKTIIP